MEPKKKAKSKEKKDGDEEKTNPAGGGDEEKEVEKEIKGRQDSELKKALGEFKGKHKHIKLVIDKEWKDDAVAQEKAVKVLEKTLGKLEEVYQKKGKEFKPGNITIILAKEGNPDIQADTWELPKGVKAFDLEKLLSKRHGGKMPKIQKKKE